MLISSAAGVARADEPVYSLEWAAPEGCPSRAQVEARIAGLIGGNGRARHTLRARATLTRSEKGAAHADVDLETTGQRASRRVEGESCDAVSEAVILMVALAVEPGAQAPTTPAPTRTLPPPLSSSAEALVPVGETTRRRSLFLAAAGRLDVASLPAPTFGGELAMGFNPRRVNLEVGAALLAAARATAPARPGAGADVRLTELGARGCYEIFDARFDLGPCAGIHARWLSARGFGPNEPRNATAIFGVASVGALGRARLSSRATLRFAVDLLAPLSRPVFEIDATEAVFRPSPTAIRVALGAELHF